MNRLARELVRIAISISEQEKAERAQKLKQIDTISGKNWKVYNERFFSDKRRGEELLSFDTPVLANRMKIKDIFIKAWNRKFAANDDSYEDLQPFYPYFKWTDDETCEIFDESTGIKILEIKWNCDVVK